MNPSVEATIDKIVQWMRGEPNERIDLWLDRDESSFTSINWLFAHCAANGWVKLEDKPLQFADVEGQRIAVMIYERANNFFGMGGSK